MRQRYRWLCLVLAALILLAGCNVPSATQPTSHQFGVQTKTSGCVASGGVPDSACPPGGFFPGATKGQICQPGYARSLRQAPESEKTPAYDQYNTASHAAGPYEGDPLLRL